MPCLRIRWWHPWLKSCHGKIRDLNCCGRNWPLSKRPRSPQSRQGLLPHPTFSFYGGTSYSKTFAFSLRSWVLWGRLHSRVLTSWARTLKSFRTGLGHPASWQNDWLIRDIYPETQRDKHERDIIFQEEPVQDLYLWTSGFSNSQYCTGNRDTGWGSALLCWRQQGSPPSTLPRAMQED